VVGSAQKACRTYAVHRLAAHNNMSNICTMRKRGFFVAQEYSQSAVHSARSVRIRRTMSDPLATRNTHYSLLQLY
jgi:hypothetical protein